MVKILEDRSVTKATDISSQGFINYIINDYKWLRINHFGFNKSKYSRKINHIIEDCIEGKYICENDDSNVSVIRRGRDLIKWTGFAEDYLRSRARLHRALLQVLSGAVGGSVVTWLLIR